MSFKAFRHASVLTGLPPHAKLVLMQLAAFHNSSTDRCDPSPARIAHLTGLSRPQVNDCIEILRRRGAIAAQGRNIRFLGMAGQGEPVPSNWTPSEAAMQRLVEAYPQHHFDMKEAVDDFIKFAHARGLTYASGDQIDAAFERSIGAILDNRPTGTVEIASEADRGGSSSVMSLLSGRRNGTD